MMVSTEFDPARDFDRQVQNLLDLGLTTAEFRERVSPLRDVAIAKADGSAPPVDGHAPFVLVVTRDLLPIEESVPRTTLNGKNRPGVVNDRHFPPGDLARFTPVEALDIPDGSVYLIFDVDRGEEFCGAVPEDAMAVIADRRRTALTIDEGIAFLLHHPAALARNKCFSLGGSRCGDRRVPALWISQGAPMLGWCWAGNPHTWLGVASCAARAA
jgi:hypothetical protein